MINPQTIPFNPGNLYRVTPKIIENKGIPHQDVLWNKSVEGTSPEAYVDSSQHPEVLKSQSSKLGFIIFGVAVLVGISYILYKKYQKKEENK